MTLNKLKEKSKSMFYKEVDKYLKEYDIDKINIDDIIMDTAILLNKNIIMNDIYDIDRENIDMRVKNNSNTLEKIFLEYYCDLLYNILDIQEYNEYIGKSKQEKCKNEIHINFEDVYNYKITDNNKYNILIIDFQYKEYDKQYLFDTFMQFYHNNYDKKFDVYLRNLKNQKEDFFTIKSAKNLFNFIRMYKDIYTK